MSGNKGLIDIAFLAMFSAVIILAMGIASAANANILDFSQCANGASSASTCAEGWINGNLNSGNSHYHEDEAVAERLVIDATNGPLAGRTIVIQFDNKKSSVHAYDSLASWNYTVMNADRCQGLSAGDCPGGTPSTFPIPDDNVAVPPSSSGTGIFNVTNVTNAHMIPTGTGRLVTMYGGTITGVTVTHGSPLSTDDTITVTITYTAASTSSKVMLLLGGHLAPSLLIRGWGTNLGASQVSGSSIHFKLNSVNGQSAGSRDNQVQPGAILPQPGTISIRKVTVPSPDPTGTSFVFTTTGGQLPSSFNLANGGLNSYIVNTGVYTITENSYAPVFNLTGLSCINDAGSTVTTSIGTRTASITLSSAGYVNCTYTNTLQQPSLVVVKHVVNDNGGTKTAANFTITINGVNATGGNSFAGSESGVSRVVTPGNYSVSETGPGGYLQTSAIGCSGNISYGQSKTCTITNDDIAPKLTVTKVVINDNGGTKTAGNFTLKVDSTTVTSGVQNAFNTGTHIVSELADSGYTSAISGDCASNGSINLNIGDVKSCTITNNDKPAHLIVIKHVVNDNGGTKSAGNFTIHINGTSGTANFAGSESGVDTQVNAGTYTVSEDPVNGYASSASGCSGSIANGETKTCTITNNDIAPMITLVKVVNNNHGGNAGVNDFGLMIGGNPATSGVAQSVNANTPIALNEAGLSGYQFVSLTGAGCPLQLGGTFTLNVGQNITCTITNEDQPAHIVLTKSVTNDNGGTAGVNDFGLRIDGGVVSSGSTIDVNSNTVHTINEDGHAGYSFVSISGDAKCPSVLGGSVTLNEGETVTCAITNDDIGPKLTVTKIVVNDNGGQKVVSDFTLKVDDQSVTSGVENTFSTGAHTVGEIADSGYTSTISGGCDENGNVNLAIGDVKSCTITNDDIAPRLTVTKVVVNNNGGTKTVSNFPLFVDSGSVTSGVQNTFSAGPHTVSETSDPGYASSISGDCAANGAITLNPGDVKSCTITNDDLPAHIIVIKHVINNNGGTKSASNFAMHITGTVGTANFNGAESPGVNTQVNAGSYSVSEDSVTGYASSTSSDCSGSIGNGETKTCTITNNDIAPMITLVKVVNNNHGGNAGINDFGLTIGGSPATSGFAKSVSANTPVALNEAGLSGYQFVSLTGVGCPTQLGGTVTLTEGQNITCTITNEDKPAHIVLIKSVTNDNDGTAGPNSFGIKIDGNVVTSGSTTDVNSNTAHTIDETGLTGYSFVSITGNVKCPSVLGGNTASMDEGETITCTITNDDVQPKLTVIKHVVNDNGGNKQVSDFSLFVGATQVTSGVQNGFNAAAYTLTETSQTGYAASVWSGDCAVDGTITLNVGDVKTCEITNDDISPTLRLVKTVVNDNGGTKVVSDFTLKIDNTTITNGTVNNVNAGAHTASEVAVVGYTGSVWGGDCNPDGTITLSLDQHATCTITNDDIPAHLIVIKHVVNDNGGTASAPDFEMTINGVASNGASFAGSEAGTDKTLTTIGSYSVSESSLAGYTQSSASDDCSGTIALGETKTCTITNDDNSPSLTLVKVVNNDNGGTATADQWTLTASGPTGFNGQGPTVNNGPSFDAGNYTLSETGPPGYGAGNWVCNGGTQNGNQLTLGLGDSVTCTITNDDSSPKLIVIKHVVNDNGGTGVASDFMISVSGTNVQPSASFTGTESPGTTITLNAGSYNVSETGPGGYTEIDSADCGGTISIGETKTCTVTNDDDAAMLTVIKHVVNDNFGTLSAGDFTIHVTGNGPFPESFAGSEDGTIVKLNVGEYSVSEDANSGYTSSFSEDCSGTLANGETKTCTITNDDKPAKLIVIKEVVNDNGGTKQVSDFSLFVDGTPVTNGSTTSLLTGTHTVSEGAGGGYVGTFGGDCDENGTVTLDVNETKTCIITNDDIQPKLTVTKIVVNDNGGTKVVSDFPLFVDNTSVVSGEENAFNAGTYAISEVSDADYNPAFGVACSPDGTITLNPGDVKTCTITNDDKPSTLIIIKHVINHNDGVAVAGNFTIHITGSNPSQNDFAGDENGVTIKLDDGLYSVDETGPLGYTPSFSSGCFGTIAKHETKTCTITNDDLEGDSAPPTVVVIKHVINNNGGTQTAGDFTMNVTGTNVQPSTSFAGSETGTNVTLDAGEYSVSENDNSGYALFLSSTCSGNITDGQLITCTILNDDKTATLTVIKHVVNDNSGTSTASDFTINVTGNNVSPSSFPGNETGTTIVLDSGAYSVSETGPGGYTQSLSECSGSVANGETKTCTVTNNDVAPAPPNGGGGGGGGGSGGGSGGGCTPGYTLESPASVDATAGSSITVGVTFFTTGTCSGSTTVTADVPSGWTATSAATGTVSASGSKTVNILLTLPSDATTHTVTFRATAGGTSLSSQTTVHVSQPEQNSGGGSGGTINNPPGPANEPETTTETPPQTPFLGGLTGLLTANPNAIGAAIIIIAIIAYLIWRRRRNSRGGPRTLNPNRHVKVKVK